MEANDSAETQATEPESEPETDTTPEPPSKKTMTAVSANLDVNHEYLQKLFAKSSDLVIREVLLFHGTPAILVFLDGLVNLNHLDEVVLKPLMQGVGRDGMQLSPPPPQDADELLRKFLAVGQARHVHNMNDAIDACMSGDTMFLLDGFPMSVIVSSKQWEHRMPSEPDTESVVRGPREGFVENIRTNTALLRRRIRTPHFQMESLRIGRVSKTDVVMSYIEGITKDSLVEEIRSRLKRIDIDGVLDSGYIEEFLEDQPWSPFPTIQPTERPDTTAAALLEGRVAILVDGSPFVLIAPSNLWGNLQSNEDYFERFMFTTLIRWLRYIFTIIALTLPSLYIAITTFHQEMMPTNLLLSIAAARESSPFPALVEAFAMEITFEALREAGVRLPKTVGQAVSIVGALVIGQAAVQAGIVSAPMVIVVSLTGIANFTIPRYTFALSVRMLRFPLMILAGTFGLYGIVIGLIAIIVHVCSLRSFGVPYTTPVAPLKLSGLKDLLARVPWWAMNKRPSPANEIRVPYGQKPHPPQDDMETEQK
ncbi:spore germination protein [Tumebacillus sp. ITR2]|uniref:Spore germination protein n=2 Tax=Tumebacillus amylolyticus TaxID=2801339 RepID=A0ABS1J7R0_9BACL|nr:spore germination protein [Tumebacillus amylolyticus]